MTDILNQLSNSHITDGIKRRLKDMTSFVFFNKPNNYIYIAGLAITPSLCKHFKPITF